MKRFLLSLVTNSAVNFLAAACALLTMAMPGALADDSDWTMGGQNLRNWRNQDHTQISPQNVATLKLKWTFTTGGDVSATPAVANGKVYFPDFAGNFYAVDANTGAQEWQQQVAAWTKVPGDYARNDPAVHGDTLILGDQAGTTAFWNGSQYVGPGAKLIAVDAKKGNLKWVTQVESFPTAMVTSSPVIYKGVAYVGIASNEELTAAVKGTPCCVSRGSVVAVDVETGKIKWQTYMVPDNGGNLGGYSGGGVWGSTPVIDPKRHSVYVGTGNNYSVPSGVQTCLATNNNNPNCTLPHDYFDSVVALDLDTGIVKWAKRALYYDAWNTNCTFTITSFSPPTYVFGPGQNCPVPTGPDYDFGGAGPNLFSVGNNDILGIGEKSGIYWALNPDNGAVVWNTLVGPGSALGGIEWGTATDGDRIYVPIANLLGTTYKGYKGNGGSWAALDPATGDIIWQTATLDQCFTANPPVAQCCMALGPASVAGGVVFAGSMERDPTKPSMFALGGETGQILWSFVAGSSVVAAPAIVGNSLYWGSGYSRFNGALGTGNNKLFAFSL
jgi:polyvinyl alcohol dehydrogenase (cytochrome)